MSTVVIPADFKLPIGIAAFGLAVTGLGNVGVGFPISFVGLLLAFQATRVSFEFDDVVGENPMRASQVVGCKTWLLICGPGGCSWRPLHPSPSVP